MTTTTQGAGRGDELRAISDAVARITRTGTGRGPVHARAFRDADAIVVLLSGALTKGEQSLVADGRTDAVLDLRSEFQDLLRPEYVAAVEEITGRRVATSMSTNTATPDHAAEIFLLGDALPSGPGSG